MSAFSLLAAFASWRCTATWAAHACWSADVNSASHGSRTDVTNLLQCTGHLSDIKPNEAAAVPHTRSLFVSAPAAATFRSGCGARAARPAERQPPLIQVLPVQLDRPLVQRQRPHG